MTAIPRKEQFSGCLIGQCLADALGSVVEGSAFPICENYVTEILKSGKAGSIGRETYAFGQYTDDSQLARELMESIVTQHGFKPHDYAARIAAIFKEERIFGYGGSTKKAAERLIAGVAWDEAGTPAPAAGNGSAMRAAPIGLFYYDAPAELIQTAYDQGRITHQDPRCGAGAVAIAGAVALALQSTTIHSKEFLTQISEWSSTIDQSVGSSILQLADLIQASPEEVAEFTLTISRNSLPAEYVERWQRISPFVTPGVLWSLYSFLRTPTDYWQTICTAIAVGGDVDTTAAMAGAISGAYLGIEVIPMDLASKLTDRGRWGLTELLDLSDQCYKLKFN